MMREGCDFWLPGTIFVANEVQSSLFHVNDCKRIGLEELPEISFVCGYLADGKETAFVSGYLVDGQERTSFCQTKGNCTSSLAFLLAGATTTFVAVSTNASQQTQQGA